MHARWARVGSTAPRATAAWIGLLLGRKLQHCSNCFILDGCAADTHAGQLLPTSAPASCWVPACVCTPTLSVTCCCRRAARRGRLQRISRRAVAGSWAVNLHHAPAAERGDALHVVSSWPGKKRICCSAAQQDCDHPTALHHCTRTMPGQGGEQQSGQGVRLGANRAGKCLGTSQVCCHVHTQPCCSCDVRAEWLADDWQQ